MKFQYIKDKVSAYFTIPETDIVRLLQRILDSNSLIPIHSTVTDGLSISVSEKTEDIPDNENDSSGAASRQALPAIRVPIPVFFSRFIPKLRRNTIDERLHP